MHKLSSKMGLWAPLSLLPPEPGSQVKSLIHSVQQPIHLELSGSLFFTFQKDRSQRTIRLCFFLQTERIKCKGEKLIIFVKSKYLARALAVAHEKAVLYGEAGPSPLEWYAVRPAVKIYIFVVILAYTNILSSQKNHNQTIHPPPPPPTLPPPIMGPPFKEIGQRPSCFCDF